MHIDSVIPFIRILPNKLPESVSGKSGLILTLFLLFLFWAGSYTSAQPVLFDFDNIPIGTTLPISETVNGITAHFTGTGDGYSIQDANVLGFTPPGFSGHVIYPNSINLADLLIKSDQTLTDFSIMYSVDELGCDNSATMRVTAYMNGSFVGTNTKVAGQPGTWPVDTLSCSFPQGFDSVVVHYDSPPPTCQDYGTIFMADNMKVSLLNATSISESEHIELCTLSQNYPNPFNPGTAIQYTINSRQFVILKVYDILGNEVSTLVNKEQPSGIYTIDFNGSRLAGGIYFCQMKAGNYTATKKLVLLK